VHYDAPGKLVYSLTRLLSSPSESRQVGTRTIRCAKYRTRLSHRDGTVVTGTAFGSRDVPGGIVRADEETVKGADKILTSRVELLAFKAK
jgi:hypothetical protein